MRNICIRLRVWSVCLFLLYVRCVLGCGYIRLLSAYMYLWIWFVNGYACVKQRKKERESVWVYRCVWESVWLCIYMYLCRGECVYVCMYVYIYIYVCVHIMDLWDRYKRRLVRVGTKKGGGAMYGYIYIYIWYDFQVDFISRALFFWTLPAKIVSMYVCRYIYIYV